MWVYSRNPYNGGSSTFCSILLLGSVKQNIQYILFPHKVNFNEDRHV